MMVNTKKSVLHKGFNEYVSNEAYHEDTEYKSSSALKLILKDPRQYYTTYVLGERPVINSDALAIGSYVHSKILEPHLVEEEYAIYNGGRRSGEAWKEFVKENENKTILTASQKALVDTMIKNYEEASVILGPAGEGKEVKISSFFTGGSAEETLCGEIDGYKVKCRFDYRKEFDKLGSINDLKTTGSSIASKEDVEEICAFWDYDLSAALYVDLVMQETGKPYDFYFIFMSKKGQMDCKIFKASDSMLERGRQKYKEAIRLLKAAELTGTYFSHDIEELG